MNKNHIKLANGSRISFSEEPLDDNCKYKSSGGLIYFEIGEGENAGEEKQHPPSSKGL